LKGTAAKSKRAVAAKRSKAAKSRKKAAKKDVGKLFTALVALQARLCAPNGCPWDREQTHETLRTYLIEETYEVLDALDSGDARKFAGELGDLLLQIIFHSYLAEKAGRFDVGDVIEHVHNKMVRRHPHVFGEAKARTSAEVLKNWEQIKAEERRAEGGDASDSKENDGAPTSVLDAVPGKLPALLEAHQLTRRAANVGFDWKNVEGILAKLEEEARELRESLKTKDREQIETEVGDVLFVGVNLARFLKFDAELALKRTNRKFSRRFREMERAAAAAGQTLGKLSADELEELWGKTKAAESGKKILRKVSGAAGT
jgi:MazG family protein